MADRLPVGEENTRAADVWIVDCDLLPEGKRIVDLFRAGGRPERVILVAVDTPEVIVMTRHSLRGVDAATFLEHVILEPNAH